MNKERFWHLASKKLANEASAEELTELEGLLRSDPDMHYALQHINDLWILPRRHSVEAEEAFKRHVNRLKTAGTDFGSAQTGEEEEINEEPVISHHNSRRKKIAWTSILTLLVLAGGYFIFYPVNKIAHTGQLQIGDRASARNEISTRNGSKTKIKLPDGTQVWLNSGSNLTYNKEFGNRFREVELSGEAFFDVVRNPEVPFIIHTRQIDIKVVGTAFNVKSYPNDQKTETTLIRGKVEVLIKNRPDEKIILKPNEKLVVMNDEIVPPQPGSPKIDIKNEPLVSVGKLTHYTRNDSIVVETAWVQNKLVFDNESFAGMAAKMQRWYNMDFEFRDTSRCELRFTGAFTTETIQQALDALRITAPFHYSMRGNKVIIDK